MSHIGATSDHTGHQHVVITTVTTSCFIVYIEFMFLFISADEIELTDMPRQEVNDLLHCSTAQAEPNEEVIIEC